MSKKVNWVLVDGAVIRQPGRGEPEAPQQVTVDYIPSEQAAFDKT